MAKKISSPEERVSVRKHKQTGKKNRAGVARAGKLVREDVGKSLESSADQRKAADERKRTEGQIVRLNRLYSVLSKVNEAIVRIHEPRELYERVCRIAIEDGQFEMAWIGLIEPDTHSVRPVASYGDTEGYLQHIRILVSDVPEGRGPTGKAIFEGKYSICSDIQHDPKMLPWRDRALQHGFRSSAAFPLRIGPEVIGAFTIYSDKTQFFTDEEINLLSSLADDLSFAIGALANEQRRLQAESALKESEERYRSLFQNSIDGILLAAPDGTIFEANPEACRIFGRTEDELRRVGRAGVMDMQDPKVTAFLEERSRTGMARGEGTGIRKDGTRFPCEQSSVLFRDRDGNIRTSIIIRDITQRKRTEEELKKYREHLEEIVEQRTAELAQITAELRRSNEDLQQFAYSASHDLQEPLHVIKGFLGLISRRYKDKLDEKGEEFIRVTIDGAKRMQELIRDLLEYSRVGTRAKEFRQTDCSDVLDKTLFNLKAAMEKSGAEVAYDDLPVVTADAVQLGSLFQNLIGNAIKFHGDEPPRVRISAEKRDGEWLFTVRDNGIGIDPKFSERVFTIFQRLHTSDEYPGTGIGLAVCKKIVERHGGKIWVESAPGKGATFCFTIPVDKAKT